MNEFLAHPDLFEPDCVRFAHGIDQLAMRPTGDRALRPTTAMACGGLPGDGHELPLRPGKGAASSLPAWVWEFERVDASGAGHLFSAGSHKAVFPLPAEPRSLDSDS